MDTKQAYILTHPIQSNYGGILQAMALQHAAHTICPSYIADYTPNKKRKETFLMRCRQTIKAILMRLTPLNISVYPINLMSKIGMHAKKTHLNPCGKLHTLSQKTENRCYIVGSDQVWRAAYARALKTTPFFFLDFANQQERAQSIAYAASFGIDTWEGTTEETEQCARLLQEFKAISVREHSGIRICKEVFGVDAVQMPDPTLLPETEYYHSLIQKEHTRLPHHPYIATYVLDSSPRINDAFDKIKDKTQLYIQTLMPRASAPCIHDRLPITIGQWLRYISKAQYLITDSFHGCVFAIIFNIPFVCIGNQNRGTTRFDSLLQTFGLENRITSIENSDAIISILKSPIDWQNVNNIRNSERQRAFDFLNRHLLDKP